MEVLRLSRAEMEQLKGLADALGVTVEEAAEAAMRRGLEDMFRLPTTKGDVLNFDGLSRPSVESNDEP